MIPGPVQHTSAEALGPTVHSFDHRRFLPAERKHNPIAFRASAVVQRYALAATSRLPRYWLSLR